MHCTVLFLFLPGLLDVVVAIRNAHSFFISSQSGAVICDSFTENLLRYAIIPISVWSSFAFWGDCMSFIA